MRSKFSKLVSSSYSICQIISKITVQFIFPPTIHDCQPTFLPIPTTPLAIHVEERHINVTFSCTLLVPGVTLHHIHVNHPIFLFVSFNSCYLHFSIEFCVFFLLVFRCHAYLWIIFQILDIANIFFQSVVISEICLLCVSLSKNPKIRYNQIYQFFMKIFFSWRYSSAISSITFTFCFFSLMHLLVTFPLYHVVSPHYPLLKKHPPIIIRLSSIKEELNNSQSENKQKTKKPTKNNSPNVSTL